MAVAIVVVNEEDGGGGGTVEFNEVSILLVDTAVGVDDVVDRLSLDVVGDDDPPVPLIMATEVLSDVVVVVGIASEFDVGEESGSTTTGGGGGGGGGDSSS